MNYCNDEIMLIELVLMSLSDDNSSLIIVNFPRTIPIQCNIACSVRQLQNKMVEYLAIIKS